MPEWIAGVDLASIAIICTIIGLILVFLGLCWKARGWLDKFMNEIENISDSVNTIQTQLTQVDLEKMEDWLHKIVFGEPMSSHNSVITTLEKSGNKIITSLIGMSEGEYIVEFEFEEATKPTSIRQKLVNDEELDKRERELFDGSAPKFQILSPRRIRFNVPTKDLDKVVKWVPLLLKRCDEYYVEISKEDTVFDKKLEEYLKRIHLKS